MGDRYGIRANDMGDDSIDTVISHIDMGYVVTLVTALALGKDAKSVKFNCVQRGHQQAAPARYCLKPYNPNPKP